jgi:hypothetical protein
MASGLTKQASAYFAERRPIAGACALGSQVIDGAVALAPQAINLHHDLRLDAEEARPPQHHITILPGSSDPMKASMPKVRGVDGVFGDVALDALVVAALGLFTRHPPPLILHLRRELPGPADHLADAPHPLAVGAEH